MSEEVDVPTNERPSLLRATIICSGQNNNPKFNFFKSILEYEGIKITVREDLPEVMQLTKGHDSPTAAAVVMWRHIQFNTPYQLLDYMKESGMRRC